ncbi:hypothetical protein ACH5RR_036721 [Cinchona calisaya]|uniref:Uncharacterized protein n=1 Tax=Cinchona calisaya TaxID=153742 RepID=A0ABD2Y410_9GENT
MHWCLLYILQGIKPYAFDELVTRAHDIEIRIANQCGHNTLIAETFHEIDTKEMDESDDDESDEVSSDFENSMVITAIPIIVQDEDANEKHASVFQNTCKEDTEPWNVDAENRLYQRHEQCGQANVESHKGSTVEVVNYCPKFKKESQW